LPAGEIRPGAVLVLSLVLIFWGCAVLLVTGKPAASVLGFFAVCWYNGFYTKFKKSNCLAAIPGALVGTIPPAIGWIAGGGNIFDLRLAALCFFFFMWQALHFFIHVLGCGREYENAGLPSLSTIFTENQLARLTFQWLLAVVVSTQFIFLFGVIRTPLAHAAILGVSFWPVMEGVSFLVRKSRRAYGVIFRRTNYYMLSVMVLMIMDGFSFSPGCRAFHEIFNMYLNL